MATFWHVQIMLPLKVKKIQRIWRHFVYDVDD